MELYKNVSVCSVCFPAYLHIFHRYDGNDFSDERVVTVDCLLICRQVLVWRL